MSSRRPTSWPAYPPELRADLRRGPGRCLLTGGQTGVDTAAALAGLRAGLPVHVVFPHGFRQEDGPLTPDRRHALRGATLHELASPEFRHRTWTCAHLADAIILIDPAGGEGCQETIRAASRLGRPLLSLPAAPELLQDERSVPRLAHPEAITSWLERARPRVLMIAGCRSSVLASQGLGHDLSRQFDALMPLVAGQRK